MSTVNHVIKSTKKIQLVASVDLHAKIKKCQNFYALKGRSMTLADTCNVLLELGAEKELSTINFL